MSITSWHDLIGPLKEQDYFTHALNFELELRSRGVEVYPPQSEVFAAFRYTLLHKLKVVIIGQDPYHEPGQAMGLSFSVPVGVEPPPSLQNIFKALQIDFPDFVIPNHGNLVPWARQGVLLLNAVLTVTRGQANSHAGQGWEQFTDAVIEKLNACCEHLVFLLWGSPARKKGARVDRSRHLVLETVHPSPLSAYRGFFECRHFSKANAYLKSWGREPIYWQLPVYLDGSEEL